jgi:hypothetical protein
LQLIILGLRRSGTTIFWQTFRQDERLPCFNEPFNPFLREVPIEIPNRSRKEFIDVFRRDSRDFWRRFAPISRIEELQETFSDRQADYLRFLAGRTGSICFDTTRCHFRIPALKEQLPDATLVHLYRTPAAFASSHLIPTGSGGFRSSWLNRAYAQTGFWNRTDRYNNNGMEELVGRHPESLFGHLLRESGVDPGPVYELPAVARLLSFWRLAYETAERDGSRCFGDRFVSVSFEAFCKEPLEAVERIYGALGEPPPEIDLSRVHPANEPFQPENEKWLDMFARAGLPDSWLPGSPRG